MTLDRERLETGARLAERVLLIRYFPNAEKARHDSRELAEFALEVVRELEQARDMLALCAADTTAPDLAQEVEFLKAELAQERERLRRVEEAAGDHAD